VEDALSHESWRPQAAVYHRDLKLENALINISAESAPYLKIADFGFSKVYNLLPHGVNADQLDHGRALPKAHNLSALHILHPGFCAARGQRLPAQVSQGDGRVSGA
jgi:serine/threonine protein kinase